MQDSVIFTIGGQEIEVPALTLYWLERCQQDIDGLVADAPFITYSGRVLNIVAMVTGKDREALSRAATVPELQQFIPKMQELLLASGFAPVGEVEAVTGADGTGTSIASPPNSQLTESSTATSDA